MGRLSELKRRLAAAEKKKPPPSPPSLEDRVSSLEQAVKKLMEERGKTG